MKGKFLFLMILILINTSVLYAKDSVQSIMLHNDGYKIFQEQRPNDNIFKNTVRDMKELARKNKKKVFSESASLIRKLQGKYNEYHNTNTSVIKYLKEKWNKPHYAKMNDEWKQKTFEKDRKKVLALYSLAQGMLQAFNDWNTARNKAVRLPTDKEVTAGFKKANSMLQKTIDAVISEEAAVYESISKELEIIKMSK